MSTNMSRGSSLQAEEPPVQMHKGRRVSVFKGEPGGSWGGRKRNCDESPCPARSCGPSQILGASSILEGVDFISVSCGVIG